MKILKSFGELNWNKSIDLQQPNRNKPKPNRKHQIQRRKYHDREQELIYWLQWIILFNGLTWFAASQFLQLVHFSSSIFISVNVMHRALNFMLTLSQSRKHGTHKKNAAMVFFSLKILVFFISCKISKMKQRTESTKYIAIKPAQVTWPNVLIAKIHKTSKIIAWLKWNGIKCQYAATLATLTYLLILIFANYFQTNQQQRNNWFY